MGKVIYQKLVLGLLLKLFGILLISSQESGVRSQESGGRRKKKKEGRIVLNLGK
jgi:hypothetical protein